MKRDGVRTLYELSRPGRCGVELPTCDVPETPLAEELVRADNGLPSVSQLDVVRHYQALSQRNFGVDSGFYPLGSCTMKYNPKVNEVVARLPGFTDVHPLQEPDTVPGCLSLMYRLQNWLSELAGLAATSLQPAAGAQGELTALLMMRAYFDDRGDSGRTQVLIPDSAHGTNPASTSMAGLHVLQLPSDERGNVDLGALRAACDDTVLGLMITNPNTLGLFEEQILEVVQLVHDCGGLVYGDGANMNALAGVVRPGDLGIDVMHYNLHKTFSTPHGGGGPGSGPVSASAELAPYLPGPVVAQADTRTDDGSDNESGGPVASGEDELVLITPARSIGPMCAYHGSFGMLVRAYAYIRAHGAEGLRQNSLHAVLNANTLRVLLDDTFPTAYPRACMHELVVSGHLEGSDVRALDISKRLIDHGFHPPTNYFPLIVAEALMIEPTETESRETLEAFVQAMKDIAREAVAQPELLTAAPHSAPVSRLDEVRAARHPILREPTPPSDDPSDDVQE